MHLLSVVIPIVRNTRLNSCTAKMLDSSFATIEWKVKKVIHINSSEERGLREYKNAKYKKKLKGSSRLYPFVSNLVL